MKKKVRVPFSWPETQGGWVKSPTNPSLGGDYGTIFDISVLWENEKYRMWVSWRPQKSIALVESDDGEHWSIPIVVLKPNPESGWEDELNRPCVIYHENQYHMWYTGQAKGKSWIGYATSFDGISWTRMSPKPVLSPGGKWEKIAVMCPDVIWDDNFSCFRMWFSGGEQYEPNAIGYASSSDGIHWNALTEPVFTPNKTNLWECDRVAACQVILYQGWHLMFYIGFADIDRASICMARSRDGITGWERFKANPIISAGKDTWDQDACYKPYVIFNGTQWLLWYNGRNNTKEQIGLAYHKTDLEF